MESIPLPKKIQVAPDEKDPKAGEITISPLYPGYGATVGNSLRRVLLSSLPGAAVYAFKIKGVSHEFTTIDYVKEDVVDISLNLKRVNLVSHSEEPVELTLKVEGEKVVTAGDIEKNSDIEIANPEQKILTLTDKAASVEMTLWVRQSRGYETVESREDEDLEVNAIAIDAIYTPIRQIGYQVENVRVGGRTDFDELKLRVETNGTISVEEAISQSAEILTNHFKLISEFGSVESKNEGEEDEEKKPDSEEETEEGTSEGEEENEEKNEDNNKEAGQE